MTSFKYFILSLFILGVIISMYSTVKDFKSSDWAAFLVSVGFLAANIVSYYHLYYRGRNDYHWSFVLYALSACGIFLVYRLKNKKSMINKAWKNKNLHI